jgi:hypothetical protein
MAGGDDAIRQGAALSARSTVPNQRYTLFATVRFDAGHGEHHALPTIRI